MNRFPLALAALALAGCTSSHKAAVAASITKSSTPAASNSAAPPTPTPSTSVDYGAQYESLVAPGNAALAAVGAALLGVPESATGPDVAKITTPGADAVDKMDETLLRAQWPAAATADIKALVTAAAVMSSELRSVDAQTDFSIPAWYTQFTQDLGKMNAAVSIVRADLGLPPKSASS